MSAEFTQVTLSIVFDGDVPAPTEGVLHVAVLDVSRLDAAAIPAARADVSVSQESAPTASRELDVMLHDVPLERGRDYTIRAHWEPRGDGEVHPGDQLTTMSVPLTVGATPIRVSVPITRIG